jgi:hypothetical protein
MCCRCTKYPSVINSIYSGQDLFFLYIFVDNVVEITIGEERKITNPKREFIWEKEYFSQEHQKVFLCVYEMAFQDLMVYLEEVWSCRDKKPYIIFITLAATKTVSKTDINVCDKNYFNSQN